MMIHLEIQSASIYRILEYIVNSTDSKLGRRTFSEMDLKNIAHESACKAERFCHMIDYKRNSSEKGIGDDHQNQDDQRDNNQNKYGFQVFLINYYYFAGP
jgi:hypothetical protein